MQLHAAGVGEFGGQGLAVVGDGSAGAVVVPDEGGQGEDSLQDADDDPGRRVFAMASEFSWPLTW